MTSRLALGTVQFGLDYGISNVIGRTSLEESEKILFAANRASVDTIDTAMNYGSSESVLGSIGVGGWKIITKLPSIPDGCVDIYQWVENNINDSLNRLGKDRLDGLLLHNPSQIFEEFGPKILDALSSAQRSGVVNKIGVSIYSPEDLIDIYNIFRPDIVQAPFNLVDRKLVNSGWLNRLTSDGVEVHTRSTFLQGLLLMKEPGAYFEPWRNLLTFWRSWLQDNPKISPVTACLAYPLSFSGISRVIIGVNCLSQFNEIISALSKIKEIKNFPAISSCDPNLINPAKWKNI